MGALLLILFFGIFILGGDRRGGFFHSFFVGFLIGRFWKVIVVIILVIAVLLGLLLASSGDMSMLLYIIVLLFVGMILGLIPFFTGRHCSMPELGKEGLKWCILSGIIFSLSLLIAILYTRAIIKRYSAGDIPYEVEETTTNSPVPPTARAPYPAVRCLTGPSAGRIYEITTAGVTMGRDPLCNIIYPLENTVVSRYHCTVYRHQGMLVLTDTGSKYGTFTEDQLIQPKVPVYVTVGMTFYLGDRNNAFEIILAH